MAAVLVLPTTAAGQQGPVAALLSTAGWLAACRRVLGDAWLVTPDGLLEPDDARRSATERHLTSEGAGWRRRVPTPAKTLVKDLRQLARARRFVVDDGGPWSRGAVDFVWQRHELFHTAGLDLAVRLGAPGVLFAPATVVWEASRWGVVRRGWGDVLESAGESRALRRADLVACGSPEVAEQVIRMGVEPGRTLITPTGIDLDEMASDSGPAATRGRLGLGSDFVVGWVGSFRPFHAVHRLVEAVAGEPDVTLLLVGDGPERPAVEARARELGVRAVFTGTVQHSALGEHLAAMDVAVVVAPDDGSFHYSPLKLAEYLAAGLAVVAPDVETISSRLETGNHLLLVPPTDREALRRAILRLRDDADLRSSLGKAGRAEVEARWSWDEQVRRICDRLEIRRH